MSMLALSFAPLAATAALGVACAVLSVFVVARRWAFIGEGISHSGFGGAGLAWLIMLMLPTAAGSYPVLYVSVIAACLGTALAIAYLSHGNRVTGDAAIGIFLVASLAFGFLAQQIYRHVTGGAEPLEAGRMLVGHVSPLDMRLMFVVMLAAAAVVITVAALSKEILAYCFDPQMAQAAGVRVGFVHYLLMLLIAVTIIIGIPITGPLLITALLVLPGATANLLSRRLRRVMLLAIAAAVSSALAGVLLNATWHFIPTGPAIVLVLFLEFVLAYVATLPRRAIA